MKRQFFWLIAAKRKFLVKLEQMEREKAAKSMHNSSQLLHPNQLKPVQLPEYIDRKPSELLR
jgi:hypothetical protein